MGIKKFPAGGSVPAIWEMNKCDVKLVPNQSKSTKCSLHCVKQPHLEITLSPQII